jgi:hypothetical protein
MADSLTAICEPMFRKCGNLNLLQPYGPSRPGTGIALTLEGGITQNFSQFPNAYTHFLFCRMGISFLAVCVKMIMLNTNRNKKFCFILFSFQLMDIKSELVMAILSALRQVFEVTSIFVFFSRNAVSFHVFTSDS